MNLAHQFRGPLGLKQPKPEKTGLPWKRKPVKRKARPGANPDYLAAVIALPCVVCVNFGFPQMGRSHAHHCTHTKDAGLGVRGQRKTPDAMAIPLCYPHHQGSDGVHTRPAWWKENFGLDVDYIPQTQDRLAHLLQ